MYKKSTYSDFHINPSRECLNMNQRWYWTLDMCILIRDYQCLHYVLIKIMIKYKYKHIYIYYPSFWFKDNCSTAEGKHLAKVDTQTSPDFLLHTTTRP